MFVAKNLLVALATILHWVLSGYMWVVVIASLLSWVNPDPYNPVVRTLRSLTEPVLWRVRRRLPLFAGGIDFSPMVVIGALWFLDLFVVRTLLDLASRLPS
jgi:YggT family protein